MQFTMEISDGSESLSTEVNTDGSSESCNSYITKDYFSCGYVGKPEYDQEELKSMEFSDLFIYFISTLFSLGLIT